MGNFENTETLARKKGPASYLVVGAIFLLLLIAGIVLTATGVFYQPLIILLFFGFLLYYLYAVVVSFFAYQKLPDVLIRTDGKALCIFYGGEWKTLPLSEIEKVSTEMQLAAKSNGLFSSNNLFLCTKDKIVYPLSFVADNRSVKEEIERRVKYCN